MRVSLIDVDSKIPNLALMKISAYHKAKGDTVGLNLRNPDKMYGSIIFDRHKGISKNGQIFPTDIEWGGSGYDLEKKLPDEIEFLKPDYDLYPSEYSQGFTTRGCIRQCGFCWVPRKEGKLTRWQHPKEFHDDRFNTVLIMDNNWLADHAWFMETSGWIKDKDLKVMEQGLDVRLLNETNVRRLADLRVKVYHFAFDYTSLEPIIREKVQLLKDYGISPKNKCDFYVYCGGDEQFDDALYRCNVLREIGASAFLMFDQRYPKTGRTRRLAKWCNRKMLYWSIPFSDYSKLKHT